MRIQYRQKFFDIWRFQLVHYFYNPSMHLLTVLFVLMIMWDSSCESISTVLGRAVISYLAIWFFTFVFLSIYLLSRSNKHYLTDQIVELGPDGVHEETMYNKTLYYWHGVVKIVSRPGLLAIYPTPDSAILIPNRVFDSRAQRSDFLSYLKSLRAANAGSAPN